MVADALRAENKKLKGSPVWIAFIVLPLISAVIGTVNYMGNIGILKDEWYSLWTQHTLFLCYFFMPALFGVYCSYLWRLEHMNGNWNRLMTMPVSPVVIVITKLITAMKMAALSLTWIAVLFIVSGKIAGLNGPFPGQAAQWLICGVLGSAAVCSLQLLLSMVIRSFAVPVGMALLGGIAGLAALAKGFPLFWPYALFAYGMRANNPNIEFGMEGFIISVLSFTVIFTAVSALILDNMDIKT